MIAAKIRPVRTGWSTVGLLGLYVVALGVPGRTAPAALRSVTLMGTRTVVVTGRPQPGPAAGTYRVHETDQGLDVRSLAYGPPPQPPDDGIQPLAESIHSTIGRGPDGEPAVLSASDTLTGIDRGAHQAYQVDDVRTVTTRFRGPVAADEHVVETGRGTNGVTFASVDFTRTTNADGSFDEDGSLSSSERHVLHVHPDFSASSHDGTPGFGLRDVRVAAPDAGTVAVTVASQGRTIGDVPVITTSYTIPRWFPSLPRPTVAMRSANRNVPAAAQCRLPAGTAPATEVRDERIQVDPTGSTRDVTHDDFYDADGLPICRLDRIESTSVDVTTGRAIGTRSDQTAVSVASVGA